MNPLQEKIVKEFREKFDWLFDFRGEISGDIKLRIANAPLDKKTIEAWLTTTLEEVYKAGKEEEAKNCKAYEIGFEKGEKNGLSRSVEAVSKLKSKPLSILRTTTEIQCWDGGFYNAIEEATNVIELLN